MEESVRMLRDSLSSLLRADLLHRIYLLLVAIHDRNIFAFTIGLVVEESFEFYRFGFTTADSDFLDTTLAAKEQILAFLIRKQGSATDFFMTILVLFSLRSCSHKSYPLSKAA